MEKKLIASKLQACLNASKNDKNNEDFAHFFQVNDPAKYEPTIGSLLESLHSQDELQIFNGKMQVIAGSATRMEIRDLAVWLFRRGKEVGSVQAVSDLIQYIESDKIPFRLTYGLRGLKVKHRCELGSGISLLSWTDIPESYHKPTIFDNLFSLGRLPRAALVQERLLPKVHVSQNEYKLTPIDHVAINDAVLCVAASGPFSPEVIVTWLDPPQWAPTIGVGYSLPHPAEHVRDAVWTTEHCQIVTKLFSDFESLTEDKKDALRLPMQRLAMAIRRSSKVDSAINLGIALESLFLSDLSDDRGELTFRLKLRVAKYIEKEITKREEVFRLIGDLYKLRSIAIHTGRVPPDALKSKDISETLNNGYSLVADAIRRFVKSGIPDWMDVQLR
ncbi:MAG TPA: hypothetical protein VMW09_04860 [Desulfatiglandales bacterium]|nr:hypothetical protein [Desulfatiglandales bacterium]